MIAKGESSRRSFCTAVLMSVVLLTGCAGARELLLVGNDEKVSWNDAGVAVNTVAGKDEVLIVDIGDRLAPKIVARLPLMNTIFGPPTNLQITPDGKLALVANSMDWVAEGAGWKPSPVKAHCSTFAKIINWKTLWPVWPRIPKPRIQRMLLSRRSKSAKPRFAACKKSSTTPA